MVNIKLKWGKTTLEVDVDVTQPVHVFLAQIQSLTGVLPENQKIMGLKSGMPKNDQEDLTGAGLTEGKTLMLIGSAETLPNMPAPSPVDQSAAEEGGHLVTEATSNGLQNIGNTCYLNAAVQMLRSIPEMRGIIAKSKAPLEKQLIALFLALDNTKERVLPLPFWSAFVSRHPAFGERGEHGHLMQHDSQEALGAILQDIKTNVIDQANSTDLQLSAQQKEQWPQLFQGELSQTVTCDEQFNNAPLDETQQRPSALFTMLSCNINEDVQTLEAGLERSFLEHIPAQSSQLQKEVTLTRTSRFSKLPEYLFVHMVRFSWRNDIKAKAKILKPITFPMILDLNTLCTDELKQSMESERAKVKVRRDIELERRKRLRHKTDTSTDADKTVGSAEAEKDSSAGHSGSEEMGNKTAYYELCGVVSHKGRSADGGHYVYWGKKADKWLIYDDENVAAVSEDDIKRLRGVGEAHIAYVLLYRSKDPLTNLGPLPL